MIVRKAMNPPIIPNRAVEAPTDGLSSSKEEKRMPPIPDKIQTYAIFKLPIIVSSIVPKIKAKIELYKICAKLK